MHFQFDVAPVVPPVVEAPTGGLPETVELLRQILEVQREQLAHLRAATAAHDMASRWRAFLARWQQDFPDLAEACRKCLPILERSYGKLIADLTERLCQDGDDALDFVVTRSSGASLATRAIKIDK